MDPTITNVAANPDPVNEGNTSRITATAADPGGPGENLLYLFDCDDNNIFEQGPQAGNFFDCPFPDGSVHTVNVEVQDKDGGTGDGNVVVTVNNLPPNITNVTAVPSTVNEGETSTITVTANDVAADLPLEYSFDCDNNPLTGLEGFEIGPQAANFADCLFPDNSDHPVNVKVEDKDLGSSLDSTNVTVNNVAPNVNAGQDQIVDALDTVFLDPATFTDLGVLDGPFTFEIDWGDGTPKETGDAPFAVSGDVITGIVSGSHVYASSGLKIVTIKVTDKDGGTGTDTFAVIVGAAVDLLITPASVTPASGSQFDLTLRVDPKGTPVDDVKMGVDFGWRTPVSSIAKVITGLPNVVCNFTNPAPNSTADGTVDCTATGDTPATGSFVVAVITFDAANIGRSDVKFDLDPARTDAKSANISVLVALPGSPVTQVTKVKVEGLVDVKIQVDLEAPAPNDTETFQIKLYASGDFPTSTADEPWRIFDKAPVRISDLPASADIPGGTRFTLMLTGANHGRVCHYHRDKAFWRPEGHLGKPEGRCGYRQAARRPGESATARYGCAFGRQRHRRACRPFSRDQRPGCQRAGRGVRHQHCQSVGGSGRRYKELRCQSGP